MNSSPSQNFDALVAQAQIAHRLIAGFYQRLLPTIKQVAEELNLTFWEWAPSITKPPCRKSSDPTDRWALDMLPLMASNYYYWSNSEAEAEAGDVILGIWVTFDYNYSDEDWTQWGVADGQEPDAAKLPMGPAIVHIFISRCDKPNGESLRELWDAADDIEYEESDIGRWQAISAQMNAMYLKKSLAEFIASPDDTIAQVRSLLAEPAP